MATTSPRKTPPKQSAAPTSHGGTAPPNGLAIAALVTGILAVLFGLTPLGFLLGIAAIVLGVLSFKTNTNRTFPLIGIITGAVGTLVSIIFTTLILVGLIAGGIELSRQGVDAFEEAARERQELIEAKKDFSKGETAIFGRFQLSAGEVRRNYVPESEFQRASEGKEYVVVPITAKNISDDSEYLSPYDFELISAGIGYSPSPLDVAPAFDSGNLQEGATITGNIVFEVPADARNLKLQYSTYVSGEELVYTLGL